MKTRMLVAGLTVGLALVAAFAFSRGALGSARTEQRPAVARAEGAGENVNGQIAALRAEVAALRERQRSSEGAPQAEQDPAANEQPPDPAPPQSLEEIQAIIDAEIAARSDAIAAHLAGEAVDRAWSAKTDQVIRDVVRAELPGSQLLDVKCGSTVCEVSLSHNSLSDQLEVGKVATIYPFDTSAIYRYHRDVSPPRTEVYLAREGTTLPVAEQL